MLRSFNPNDLPQIVAIESTTQISPWPEDIFKKCLEAGSVCWVVEINEKLAGFILVLFQTQEAHILNFCVHPDYQRRGVGCQLLTHALAKAKAQGDTFAYLEVRRSNQKAIALYQKMGFCQIGERKEYYTGTPAREDALVFAKDLMAE